MNTNSSNPRDPIIPPQEPIIPPEEPTVEPQEPVTPPQDRRGDNRRDDHRKEDKGKSGSGNFNMQSLNPRSNDKFEEMVSFAKENKRDTIAYVLMIIGILFMFFNSTSLIGSLMVGGIFGLYFMDELYYAAKNLPNMADKHGLVKVFVMAGTLLALFFRAPFFFVAIAIVLGIKMIIFPDKKEKKEAQDRD